MTIAQTTIDLIPIVRAALLCVGGGGLVYGGVNWYRGQLPSRPAPALNRKNADELAAQVIEIGKERDDYAAEIDRLRSELQRIAATVKVTTVDTVAE